MNINELKGIIKGYIGECIHENNDNDLKHLKLLYNNPDVKFAIKHYGSVDKYKKMLRGKILRLSKKIEESTPRGFPMGLKRGLLKRYGNNPAKAYATMWKLHEKYGDKLNEMWVGF